MRKVRIAFIRGSSSVLGPLLFIIFINDIDNAVDIVHCSLFKFVDDTKGIHIVNSKEDAVRLQLALDNLQVPHITLWKHQSLSCIQHQWSHASLS